MTPYARAVHGYKHAFTVSDHESWAEKVNQAWASMTNEEKLAEPFVMDHHFKELVEKGLWKPVEKKALPPPDQDLATGFLPPKDDAESSNWLRQRIQALENALHWQQTEHAKLKEIYNKLADQWNAFQAVHRPTNRDVHRAEEAGELARKLAEMILRMAYSTGKWGDLLAVLNSISVPDAPRQAQGPAAFRLPPRK